MAAARASVASPTEKRRFPITGQPIFSCLDLGAELMVDGILIVVFYQTWQTGICNWRVPFQGDVGRIVLPWACLVPSWQGIVEAWFEGESMPPADDYAEQMKAA